MTTTKKPMNKFVFQMFIGALIGAAATAAFLALFGRTLVDTSNGGTMIAVVAGLCYALMGFFVGFGAIAPAAGARFLNVEDPDELREERGNISSGAIVCVLVGVFLLALASSGPGFGRELALTVAVLSLFAMLAVAYWSRGRTDELTQKVSTESAALAMQIGLVVLAVWSALAHLGYVWWIEPLALIASASLLQLATAFWVAGRKGMLTPR